MQVSQMWILRLLSKNIGNPQLDSKQAKGLISGPFARRTKDLLKLNRPTKMGSRTTYRTLSPKRAPFQIGINWWSHLRKVLIEEDESATHILCDFEAVACLRFCHLVQFFMEPSDYYDAPIYKVLHFIWGVGLING
jgi:hypothetical protein